MFCGVVCCFLFLNLSKTSSPRFTKSSSARSSIQMRHLFLSSHVLCSIYGVNIFGGFEPQEHSFVNWTIGGSERRIVNPWGDIFDKDNLIRSLSLARCPTVQSLIIEQRSLAPSSTAADEAAFASLLQIATALLKATAAISAASSPGTETTVGAAVTRYPRRSAIVEWEVEECGSSMALEVEEGWMLGPKAKEALTASAWRKRLRKRNK